MKTSSLAVWLICLCSLVLYLFVLYADPSEAQRCCSPPQRHPMVPRYPQGKEVTVYIDTTGINTPSGFSNREITAISAGLEDWNNEPNNSGVTFRFVETSSPPSIPTTANIAIVRYQNVFNESAIAETQTQSSGEFVFNTITFYQNIRRVFNPEINQPPFVRTIARHEGGHTLGLDNAVDCPPGSTIMNIAPSGETFISTCDNTTIATDATYPSPTPTPSPSPTPQEGDFISCNNGVDDDGDSLIDCDESACNHYCVNGCNYFQDDICRRLSTMGCFEGQCYTPVLIDIAGNGLQLSDVSNGIVFNLMPDLPAKLAWTTANSDDAWLVLDRNGNGTIDSGEELFGSTTPQPARPDKNGFLALAEYDLPTNGGNNDGTISPSDNIFELLRLWQDTNVNGISEATELSSL